MAAPERMSQRPSPSQSAMTGVQWPSGIWIGLPPAVTTVLLAANAGPGAFLR